MDALVGAQQLQTGQQPGPPPKRPRRAMSTSDFIRERRLRAASQAALAPVDEEAETVPATMPLAAAGALVPAGEAEPPVVHQYEQDSINNELAEASQQLLLAEQEAGTDLNFERTLFLRSKQLEAGLRSNWESKDSKSPDEPVLQSVEELLGDLSIKHGLRLATTHSSFKWLHRLPPSLRCRPGAQAGDSTHNAARDNVQQVCRECLPIMASAPDKAVKWMDQIIRCLSWYEVEGPAMPTTAAASSAATSAVPEERSAWRRVEEWDEAFRSLQTLLRQGLISSFVVVAERFTVTVFGDGSGPWDSANEGCSHRPTQQSPCAIVCPSHAELRMMLQENHVAFDIADVPGSKGLNEPAGAHAGFAAAAAAAGDALATASTAVVPFQKLATAQEENLKELRDLRRDNEKVLSPERLRRSKPSSTALWLEGAWRVHALLDVLRQFFLAAPLALAPASPSRLPRLIAPVPFSHAALHAAQVVKTQTQTQRTPGSGAAAGGAAGGAAATNKGGEHIAELSGCFFPLQVKRMLELLRVPLPSFSCRLVAESRHSPGINAFTKLGSYRVDGVRCEKDGANTWKWDFELGGA
mmetsp:Transcript_40518/g.75272  ORF Transcript_40518/g.75272 Transcript_40518/m.75272 type:complete len:583 (+) Transcript_40518:103-1851(+)